MNDDITGVILAGGQVRREMLPQAALAHCQ
jgi:molybdopterin-guanine dinucleotide biosynthesis protein A